MIRWLRHLLARLRPALILTDDMRLGDVDRRAARRVERERSTKAHWRRRASELRAARVWFVGAEA